MIEKSIIIALGVIAFFWALRDWRRGLRAALVLLVFEGALRKWVVPGSQQLVYFAKDVVLLGCYLGFFNDNSAKRYRIPAPPLLVMLSSLAIGWGAFEIFNPNLPNVLVGIMGLKAYFLYIPLMFLVPACFRSDGELLRFLRRYLLLVIPIGMLAVVQFRSPVTSVLNTYGRASDEQNVVTFGSSEHVRATGTFSFITGYTSYLVASTVLLLAILGGRRWSVAANRLHYLALVFAVFGMFLTGSRGPVFTLAILFPFYWYLAVMREGDTGATLSRAVLAIGISAIVISTLGGTAVTAFFGRASGSTDVPNRLSAIYESPWELLPDAGLTGVGIGATHQMAATLAPAVVPYYWLRDLNTEVETGRIMLELGAIGFLLVFLLRVSLALIAYSYAQSLRTRFHRALAIGAFLFFLAEFFGGPVFDVTCGVYYWFFAGLMMLAVRLDRDTLRAAAASATDTTVQRAALPAAVAAPNPRWQPLAR